MSQIQPRRLYSTDAFSGPRQFQHRIIYKQLPHPPVKLSFAVATSADLS
jgi:hypothetical protein